MVNCLIIGKVRSHAHQNLATHPPAMSRSQFLEKLPTQCIFMGIKPRNNNLVLRWLKQLDPGGAICTNMDSREEYSLKIVRHLLPEDIRDNAAHLQKRHINQRIEHWTLLRLRFSPYTT